MTSTRRDFMKDSAVLAAGIVSSTAVPGWAGAGYRAVSANGKIVIGCIGCRNMGWANLEDFLKHPEVECAALCDVDENVLLARAKDLQKVRNGKPRLVSDFRRLLEQKDIDAVIVATPDHWHCLQTVQACEAGKDVYVEKPLANTIAECDAMLRTARRTGRVVQVGQQQRSGGHWSDAMAFIRSGALGGIQTVKIWANFNYGAGRPAVPDEPVPPGVDFDLWLGPAPLRSFNKNRFHGLWRLFWDYGGGLQTDWGVHLIDMGLWGMGIEGFPRSVIGSGGIFAHRDHALETMDTQTVVYAFEGFQMTWEHHGGIQTGPWGRNYGIAFMGTNGTLVADRDNWEVIPEWDEGKPRMEAGSPQKSDQKDHEKHVADFLSCVKTRQRPAADVEIGRNSAMFAHLGNIAVRTGHTLVWNDTAGRFENDPDADALIKPVYRSPWIFPEV